MKPIRISETYLDIDNYQLFIKQIKHIDENREKAVLVFLHDSWGCTEMWNDFPEKLVEISGLDALIYDRQGYGKSSPFTINKRTNHYLHNEAAELIRILDTLNIKKAVLYGHSDGASIALITAALYPERIDGLLVEGAHSFVEKICLNEVRKSRELAKHNALLKSLAKFHGDKAPELFRIWHETWLSDEFSSWTIVPLLKDIRVPVLGFQGDRDEFGTIEQLNSLKKEIPSEVTVAEIPNAGHTPRKEAETETLKWIKEYFTALAQQA